MALTFVTQTVIRAKDNASTVYREVSQSARNMARSMRNAQRAADAVHNSSRRALVGVGAPLASAAAASITITRDFQEAQNAVFAAIDGATAEQRAKLEAQSRALGSTTAFAATQAANAQEALAKAGLTVNQVLSSTPGTLGLASAAALDLGEAAGITATTLAQFQIEAGEAGEGAGRVADVLTRGGNLANTTVSQLSEALREAGPVANSFGQGLERTVAELDAFAKAGFTGSQAGTAFRAGVIRLTGKSSEASKALQSLGLNASDFFNKTADGEIQFLGYANALDTLSEKGANANDLIKVFGEEAGPKLLALMNVGADGIRDFESALLDSRGAAQRAADTRLEGLPKVFAEFQSAWEGLNISLTQSGGFDSVIGLAEDLTAYMQELSEMPQEELKEFIENGLGIAKVIGGVVAASFAIKTAIFVLGPLAGVVKGVSLAYGASVAAMTAASNAFKVGTIADMGYASQAVQKNMALADARLKQSQALFKKGLVLGVSTLGIVNALNNLDDRIAKTKATLEATGMDPDQAEQQATKIIQGENREGLSQTPVISQLGNLSTDMKRFFGQKVSEEDTRLYPGMFTQPDSNAATPQSSAVDLSEKSVSALASAMQAPAQPTAMQLPRPALDRPALTPARNEGAERVQVDNEVKIKVESDDGLKVREQRSGRNRRRMGRANLGTTVEIMP